MSSRSTSPIPPPSSSTGGGGGGGTLSNDALYAPLSTYAECITSTSTNDNYNNSTPTSNSKNKMKKQQPIHSLSLQTSSSLRESSLLSFLTSMSTNLKTSHPHEYPFYRGIGGAVSKYGMGDTDRVAATTAGSTRSLLEGKLLNRSLILVGGGVYNGNTAAAAAATATAKSNGKEKMSLLSSSSSTRSSVVQQAGASNSAGKRERKRVGGNGLFGCISNKKRKKMLQKMQEDRRLQLKHDNRQSELKVRDGTEYMEDALKEKEDNPLLKPQKESTTTRLVDTQQNIGKVIENLHQMWMGYMQQLLHAMAIPNNKDTTPKQEVVLTLEHRKQVSLMLTTSEHVGMAATIIQCPSRRHLVNTRCIVVNETKETWKIAMMIKIPKKKPSQEGTDVMKEGGGNSASTKDGSGKLASDGVWKIVMVPKRGTVLDVQLPLEAAKDSVTVRLES